MSAEVSQKSDTKPKLVAKILVTNFGNHLCIAMLPKSVANVNSQFHHLVNTGLAVGSLVKWLPKYSPHLQIR